MNKTRNSNIELLRIISMLFIVTSHFTVHNGINNPDLPLGFNRYLLEISTLGNIGVIIFVLITGYFLVSKSQTHIRQIAKISIQVFFYSFIFFIIGILFLDTRLSIMEAFHYILPVIFGKYWFATSYVVLYVLTPFLNKFLNSLTRKEYLYYLLVMILIGSVIPTITTGNINIDKLFLMILYYSIGGYLNKFSNNIFSNKPFALKSLILSTCLLFISPVIVDILSLIYFNFSTYNLHFFNGNSVVAILFAVSLFSIFANKKTFSNKFINTVSSCTFGVYLIHEHPVIREILWTKWIPVADFIDSPYLILVLLVSVLSVFIACIVIEFIRKTLFDFMQKKLLDKHLNSIQIKWNIFSENLCNKFIKN